MSIPDMAGVWECYIVCATLERWFCLPRQSTGFLQLLSCSCTDASPIATHICAALPRKVISCHPTSSDFSAVAQKRVSVLYSRSSCRFRSCLRGVVRPMLVAPHVTNPVWGAYALFCSDYRWPPARIHINPWNCRRLRSVILRTQ